MQPDKPNLSPSLAAVVDAAVRVAGIVDSHGCARPGAAGPSLTLYVVPDGPWPDELTTALDRVRPPDVAVDVVAVSHLPLDGSGRVDEAALFALPTVTPAARKRLARVIDGDPAVHEAVVLIDEIPRPIGRLHRAELDPDWTRPGAAATTIDAPRAEPAAAAVGRPPAEIAGGPLTAPPFADLPSVLAAAADRTPDAPITFVDAAGATTARSHRWLYDTAARIHAGLSAAGLVPGDRVVLALDPAESVLPAFWGCLLGGFVPLVMEVPAAFEAGDRAFEMLGRVAAMLDRPLLVCGGERVVEAQAVDGVRAVAGINRLRAASPTPDRHRPAPDDLAFLCFSSGSTGTPKCIMLTHRCVLMRNAGTNRHNDHRPDDVNLNWLPFDHIGSLTEHIRSLMLGCALAYVGKDYILEAPLRLLDVIDAHRVTHTWGPNFVYALIAEALAEPGPRTWDLSCVRFLISGGEAASHDAMASVLERAGRFGFPRTGFRPSFGMVEVSAGITYFEPSAERPLGFVWVARAGGIGTRVEPVPATTAGARAYGLLGRPINGCDLRVVDADGAVLPEGTIGRVQFRGAPLAAGYLDAPALTAKVFLADGWLETEDLGFVLDGELVLTGRTKEMLIINGVNYYSRELEDAVERLDHVQTAFTAACAVRPPEAPTEQLAVFFCPHPDADIAERVRAVRNALVRRCRANPDHIVPLRPSDIPKTAIGKIRRLELAARFESGAFEDMLRDLDRALGNRHTLPDHLLAPRWVACRPGARAPIRGALLVGAAGPDRDAVSAALEAAGRPALHICGPGTLAAVPPGEPAADLVWLTPRDPDALTAATADLRTYLVGLDERPGRVVALSTHRAAVPGLGGLLATVEHEFPQVRAVQLDAPLAELPGALADALDGRRPEPRLRWRDGQRFVERLAPVSWGGDLQRSPIAAGETWLLLGGQGAIGQRIAERFVERYRARVVSVGRTPRAASADAPHIVADLSTTEGVDRLIAALDGRRIDGVVHLAATADERLLVDEDPAALGATVAAHLTGLTRLDAQLGGARWLYLTAAVAHRGAFGCARYAALHAALSAFAADQRRRGVDAGELCSTQWSDIGVNAGHARQDTAREARGASTWEPADAVDLLCAALRRPQSRLLMGLDPQHPAIAHRLLGRPRALRGPMAWVAPAASAPVAVIDDDFGVSLRCPLRAVAALPRHADGAVDTAGLRASAGPTARRVAPRTTIERLLAELWSAVLKVPIGVHDDFFEAGGDSIKAVMVMNQLQRRVSGIFHPVSLFDAPTVAGLARYLGQHYPQAFAALDDDGPDAPRVPAGSDPAAPASAEQARHMRSYLRDQLAGAERGVDDRGPRNRRAVFILSPARSGSTLLRVILAGNPALFSPPELYLLGFRGLAERQAAFSGRQAFLREGVIRALMALDGLDVDAAEARMAALEAEDLSVKALYGRLQARLGDRLLVDKTPPYAFDPAVLARMEAEFEDPLYIHLQRHPAAMIHSFEEARVDLAVAVHGDERGLALSTRQKGELWWRISHENIVGFLDGVPAERRHRVRYEELVRTPEPVLRELCDFIGVPFADDMLHPQRDGRARMTDGAHHFSKLAGDPKFHSHSGITAAAADRWRAADPAIALADETWALAGTMGYVRDGAGADCPPELLPFAVVPDRDARHAPFPLTDIQQAYWAGRDTAFALGGRSVHAYTEIDGVGVDLDRLEDALNRMVERHEMLRTVIGADGRQRILEAVPRYVIDVDDLRDLAPTAAGARLASTRGRMSHQVLPCATWPTFEVCASRLAADRVRVHLSVDALFFDARSKYIFFGEWQRFYDADGAGLPPLALSFRDYVLQERAIAASAIHDRDRDYWLARIADLPGPPGLPLVARPEDLGTPRFFQCTETLDPATWSRIKARAARHRLTPSAVLLGVFADALRPWSRAPRFTLNLTTYRRLPLHRQVDDVIGDFSSVVLLAVDAPGETDFATRARALHRQLMQDLAHGSFGGIEVMRALARQRGDRAAARAPVVFTCVLGDEMHRPDEAPLEWLGEVAYNVTQTPQIWFDHIAFEEGGGLLCRWNFVEGLFADGVPEAVFAAYIGALRRLADDDAPWSAPWPETRDALLPAAQRAARIAYNATAVDWPADVWLGGRLHDGFVAQARRRPDAPAVIADDRTLSYGELYRLASRVARHLRARGAAPGERVAVAMEKGWAQIAGVLGVLLSGAAYVPVDPSQPSARVADLLTRGEVSAVLTCAAVALPSLSRGDLPDIERVDIDGPAIAAVSAAPLESTQDAADLAYVIFTSGSTGRPKGVAIDHRGAWNTIVDMNRRFAVGPDDRVLALSALGFDLSVYDVFGLLAAGGAIVMPRPGDVREPARWVELVDTHRVTLWNTVPAFVGVLLDYVEGAPTAHLDSLRVVLMSGDWIPLPLPDRIRALPGQPAPISLGGATEGSIWSIWHPIERVQPGWSSIPYGRPLCNQTMHVLDDALEPCPDHVPGMIYIGGVGVALGYFGDTERTAASFVHHPRTGERLYRTGDLGRMVPDGGGVHIEFLGRVDHQVKVQGFRVELGEIEACLERDPDVAAVVVDAVGERHADKVLAAYVVPTAGAERAGLADRLRVRAGETLPGYMVPSRWMLLDELPLSGNGKVDRAALPAPTVAAPSAPAAATVSADPGPIGAVVAEVLERAVGPDDDFFDLGATSIDIMRIANALTHRLGLEVSVDGLFHHPTVRGIAGLVGQPMTESLWSGPRLADVLQRHPRLRDPEARRAFHDGDPGLQTRSGPAIELDPTVSPALAAMRRARRSHRHFDTQPLPLVDLAGLLGCLRRFDDDGELRRPYGSAGGLYPVQVFVYVKPERVDGLAGGYHHYDPAGHRLVRVADEPTFDATAFDGHINRPVWQRAAFSVHLVADLGAIAPMYGADSLQFATIEAGLISQLLELYAPQVGLGLCQMGGVDFDGLRALFDCDADHVALHALVGGALLVEEVF